ncbi:MAG: hypothetical protein H7301_11945 [Cryobacterium sp.]|nr:hypothetical protein [Oligoflexia bacterium]
MFRSVEGIDSLNFRPPHFRKLLIAFIRTPQVKTVTRWIASSLRFTERFNFLSRHRIARPSSSSVVQLDQVLNRAGSLHLFLKDESLQLAYYDALKNYFSSRSVFRKFPKKSFDAVLGQIRVLAREIPEFSAAAWALKPNGTDFRIQMKEQNCGRKINPFLWRVYRYEWLDQLKLQSERLSEPETKRILTETLARVRNFEKNLNEESIEFAAEKGAKAGRKSGKIRRNRFYADLVREEPLRRVAAKFLHAHLVRPQNQIFFEFIDADLIIYYLNELKQNPRKTLPPVLNAPIPNALLSVIKSLVPDPAQLLADRNLFPENPLPLDSNPGSSVGIRHSEYSTSPVRPFHAIWSGIFGKDCLGGDASHLDKLCPARWAIPLLSGTKTWFVERNEKYQGFVRTVPLRHPQFKKDLYNVEVWVPAMNRTAVVFSADKNQTPVQSSVFDYWFNEWLRANIGPDQALLVSDSRISDNEKVKETIFLSKMYTQGTSLSLHDSLFSADPMIEKMNEAIPPPAPAREYYRGSIVLDSTLNDVTGVTILNTREARIPLN